MALPYLDTQVVAFLRSLPSDLFGPPGFHDAAIGLAAPELAEVPFAPGGRPRRTFLERARYNLAALRRLSGGLGPGALPRFWLPRLARQIGCNAPPDSMWWLGRACHLQELHRALVRIGGSLV